MDAKALARKGDQDDTAFRHPAGTDLSGRRAAAERRIGKRFCERRGQLARVEVDREESNDVLEIARADALLDLGHGLRNLRGPAHGDANAARAYGRRTPSHAASSRTATS